MYCAHCGTEVPTLAAPCPACRRPASGATTTASGASTAVIIVVVIIAGLMLVAILGIVAAIAIPNFINSVEFARQKRTRADLRSIGDAISEYATDNNFYPEAESMDELAALLEPRYLEPMPRTDGWKNELRYGCWPTDPSYEVCDFYILVSPGADGLFENNDLQDYDDDPRRTHDANEDIVHSNGFFILLPERL